jgi:hypothetical protein
VTNSVGVPVAGAAVQFAVTAGGGSLDEIQSVTDSQGMATTKLTLGKNTGTNTVTATATGLTGSPLTFTAVATTKTNVGQLISE